MTNTLIRRSEVENMVRLSRSTIYAMISRGEFPPPLKIGRRAVAWRLADVQEWIDRRQRGQDWV
jgi:prophage regulatory protein